MERPSTVPEQAYWDAGDNEWCLPERDAEGKNHGLVKWWRPDGTLCCATEYVHGAPHGTFTRFHENGEVSREGAFVDGKLHGTNKFHRSTGETTENFPSGLGEHIKRAEMDYDMGRIVAARCYDAQGRQCMENGDPFPEKRPDGVPSDAHFRKREADGEYRWVVGTVVDNNDGTIARTGTWRWWSPEGVLVSEELYEKGELHGLAKRYDEESGALVEEITYAGGEKHGPSRSFGEGGVVTEESTWDEDERKGPYTRLLDDEERGEGAAVKERGTAAGDDSIGVVEYLDASGKVIATIDSGLADDLEATQSVLGAKSGFGELAGRLAGQKKVGASILALARAVGRGEVPAERLKQALRALERPVSDGKKYDTTRMAKMVVSNIMRFGGGPDKCVNHMMEAIRAGGFGSEILRHSAGVLDDTGEPEIALELVNAAIAVAEPDEATSHEYTRALVRASVGDADGAKASVAALAASGSDAGPGMQSYIAALFPTWDFWPTRDSRMAAIEKLAPLLNRVESRRRNEVAAVRLAMQKSATRLVQYRQRLVAKFGEKPWIVPDVSHLLPDGPVEVPIPDGYGGIGIHHYARQEWTRLTWLAWLSGLDRLALPEEYGEPVRGVPIYLAGHARFYLAFDADPLEYLPRMLEGSDIAEPGRHAELMKTAIETARETNWFGLKIADLESSPDASFLRDDEQAFIGALAFLTTPGYDLFGEEEEGDDEDEDEEASDGEEE